MNFARAKTVSSRTPVLAVAVAVAVAALLALGSLVAFAAEAPQGAAGPEAIGPEGGPPAGVSTFQKPEGYEEAKAAEVVRPDAIVDQQSGARVLIMRESYSDRPWSNYPESSNVMVLQSFGFTEGTYGVVNTGDKYLIAGMYETSDFTTIDFNKFEVIIVENDNSQWFFDALSGVWQQIEQWVANGGALVFHGAEVSWHGGRYGKSDNGNYGDVRPPGMTLDQSAHNVWYSPPGVLYQNWVDPIAHPEYAGITAGMVSPTWGNYTSHDVFYNVVEGGSYTDGPGYIRDLEVLTTDSAGRATSFVYHYPKDDNTSAGCVYFGGLTLEWGYYYNYDYGRKMLPQLLDWALSCDVQVQPSDPQAQITPGYFEVELNQEDQTTKTLIVSNQGEAGSSLEFVVSSDSAWLSVQPNSGTVSGQSSQDVTLTVSAVNLAPGNYQGHLPAGTNDPVSPLLSVPVFLTVKGPNLEVSPSELSATLYEGNNSIAQSLRIRNTGNEVMSFTVTTSETWLQVDNPSGQVPAGSYVDVIVTFVGDGQTPQSYSGEVRIATDDPDEAPWLAIPAHLTINPVPQQGGPVINVDPHSLSVTLIQGTSTTSQVHVINSGAQNLTIDASTTSSWLAITPQTATLAPGAIRTFQIGVSAEALAVGVYSGTINVDHNDSNVPDPYPITVQLTVVPQPAPVETVLGVNPRYISPDDNDMSSGIASIDWSFLNAEQAEIGLVVVKDVNGTWEIVKSLIGSGTGTLDYTKPFGDADNPVTPVTVTQESPILQTSWFGRDEDGRAVTDGQYMVVLMALDEFNNWSYATQPVGVDTTPPEVAIGIGEVAPLVGQAAGAPPTVYYSVDVYLTVHDDLAGIYLPDPQSPDFDEVRPRIQVKQNNMPESEYVTVFDPEVVSQENDGRDAVLRFTYVVVKAPPTGEDPLGANWDGLADVTALVFDQSFAPNGEEVTKQDAFNVDTARPEIDIINVSPGSDSKNDPFQPEFKDGAYTTSAIKVRYTAKAKELEGSVRLKIYQGGTVTIGRDQFDGHDPMPIRTLGPIETGALSDPDGDGNYTAEVTFHWDGTNDVGDFVKSGVYKLVVKAEDNQGRASDTDDERIFVSFPPMVIGDLYVYPNPVKPGHQATFVMSLNRPSDVLLEIYNTAGERINAAAFTGRIGTQEYVWDAVTDSDGEPLVNGVYLYKVTVFDESNTPVYQVGRLFVLR